MAVSVVAISVRSLFIVLGCVMLATLIYTISIDGLPFRKDLLTPWMAATLVDFYINIVAIGFIFLTLAKALGERIISAFFREKVVLNVTIHLLPYQAWILYKESSWISALLWLVLLVCFGSITTCTYIVLQFLKLSRSPQESLQDAIYLVLQQHKTKNQVEEKRKFSVISARVLFSALGCLMLGTLIYTLATDGSPFRTELLTPWMTATLIDFYINVVALSVWVVYKESSWLSSFLWIVLLICFGSITTCAYIVRQLFTLSSQDPVPIVLFSSSNRLQ